jgi:hypothetical protein
MIGAAKDPAHAYSFSIADLANFEHTFCKKEQNTGVKDILYKNQVQSAGACAILILIAVCVFNAHATAANCISQICRFDRRCFEDCDNFPRISV